MPEGWIIWVPVIAAAWLAFACLCHALKGGPRPDVEGAIAFLLVRLYSRLVHRLRVEGVANIPAAAEGLPVDPVFPGRGLIVVCNHTAGVDPLLVQAACKFEIRWMMARDMAVPSLDWLWRWVHIIMVGRVGGQPLSGESQPDPNAPIVGDTASTREAIRHLEAGGVVGLFPEGGIERPPHTLRPFMPGIGLLVKKTGALVLPVIIDGTPYRRTPWESLLACSRSRVRFLPVADFTAGSHRSAKEIVADIHTVFERETGWPTSARHDRERPRRVRGG